MTLYFLQLANRLGRCCIPVRPCSAATPSNNLKPTPAFAKESPKMSSRIDLLHYLLLNTRCYHLMHSRGLEKVLLLFSRKTENKILKILLYLSLKCISAKSYVVGYTETTNIVSPSSVNNTAGCTIRQNRKHNFTTDIFQSRNEETSGAFSTCLFSANTFNH